jgi:PIN domain nuclease of toxin-antitoxin system
MAALLLDTHALIWFLAGSPMRPDALAAISTAQAADTLFVSPISAWEAALALSHRNSARRPDLLGQDAGGWFRRGRQSTGAKLVRIGMRIALEAARVPEAIGHGDPGDCYLIATARVRNLSVVTRDALMAQVAKERPDYLRVVPC